MYRNSEFSCFVLSCRYNNQDSCCEKEFSIIAEVATSSEFFPICKDYDALDDYVDKHEI